MAAREGPRWAHEGGRRANSPRHAIDVLGAEQANAAYAPMAVPGGSLLMALTTSLRVGGPRTAMQELELTHEILQHAHERDLPLPPCILLPKASPHIMITFNRWLWVRPPLA